MASQVETIDQYIAPFPPDVRTILESVRRTIRKAAPEAEETISYGMPTFTLGGKYLVYFAAWKRHIAIYAVSDVDEALDEELSPYKAAKGTLQFPMREPVPYELIERVVAHHVRQRQGG